MFKIKNIFSTFIFSFILLFSTSLFSEIAPLSHELAKQYRYDKTKSEEENDAIRIKVLEQFVHSLPVYNEGNDLDSIVKTFFKDFIKESADAYTITNAMESGVEGRSDDAVFLIKDSSGQLQYVVKSFTKPMELKGKFLREFASLEFLLELKLPELHPIQPLALGVAQHQDELYGLMLENAAAGKRMDQYLFDIAAEERGSSARKERLELAKQALTRMAEAIASLHAKKSDTAKSIPDTDLKKWEKRIKKIVENPKAVEEISKKIDLNTLLNYVEKVKNDALQVPMYHMYLHGSTHFGNVFYDLESNLITLIDVGALVRSFDREGEPMQAPFIDILRPERDLIKKGITTLTTEELEILRSTFFDTYENLVGKLDEVVYPFFKTSEVLRSLGKSIEYLDEQDPELKKSKEAIFNYNLEYMSKQIES